MTAAFDFAAATDTTTASTTGDFDTTINNEAFTGTWHAYDVGSYAVWTASGKGTFIFFGKSAKWKK